ncbi:MAG: hypothetical protein ACTSV1_04805 [Alphaproteobacteria bacterium]
MAGITTIIAIIAFFAAIASLWMATEALKKIEGRVQKTIDSRLKVFRKSVVDIGDAVQALRKNQEAVVNRVKDVTRNREAADVELQALRAELVALKQTLNSTQPRRTGTH